MGTTRNARIAGGKVSDETPEGQEVAELNSDQTAGMDRHVEATGDGQGVQAAESSGKNVSGKENPVEAPDWEQETKPSCAEICAGEAGSDRPDEAPDDACQGTGTEMQVLPGMRDRRFQISVVTRQLD